MFLSLARIIHEATESLGKQADTLFPGSERNSPYAIKHLRALMNNPVALRAGGRFGLVS
jgi:hypothetical protein